MNKKIISLIVVLFFSFFLIEKKEQELGFRYLQTSFLTILKNVVEENKPKAPDLIIDKVSLRKISDPKSKDNYYRYYATVKIKNLGGAFANAKVVIDGGSNNQYDLIKNSREGLNLENGESYIVDRHEVLFDGSYNSGTIDLSIRVLDRDEGDKDNNSYTINIFEGDAKIKSIGIEQILDDGTFELNYDLDNYALNLDDFSVFVTDSFSYDEEEQKYAETFGLDKKYSYYRLKSNVENINGENWYEESLTETGKYFVKFEDDPYQDDLTHFVYLKATNSDNGNYAVSNIIKLPPQIEVDHIEFAKLFIDYAEINLIDDDFIIYEDIEEDSWYAPYVQTLYYLGVLEDEEFNYKPTEKISRAKALQIILEYYDLDLSGSYDSSYFEDISLEDSISAYTQALYTSGKAGVLGEQFNLDQSATKNYLKYLIYAYKKDT